jgi:hypothetical protein
MKGGVGGIWSRTGLSEVSEGRQYPFLCSSRRSRLGFWFVTDASPTYSGGIDGIEKLDAGEIAGRECDGKGKSDELNSL